MKIIYLTLCLLLMASVSWAQEWTEIKGKVMRDRIGQSMVGRC